MLNEYCALLLIELNGKLGRGGSIKCSWQMPAHNDKQIKYSGLLARLGGMGDQLTSQQLSQ